jgi:DnaD/phage-associated family protein
MAKGRMINNSIMKDRRIHALSSDTCRLAFTWLVTLADCEGRVWGDPPLVRSELFPRRDDITSDMVRAFIAEWQAARDPETGLGLVVWYEARGDLWIWFPGFEDNQAGLRKEREPESVIPAPPEHADIIQQLDICATEPVRNIAGKHPANIRQTSGKHPAEQNRTEQNRNRTEIEVEPEPEPPSLSSFFARAYQDYETEVGIISPAQLDDMKSILDELEKRHLESWWHDALVIAANANARNWRYVRKVLTNCLDTGKAPNSNGKQPARQEGDLDARRRDYEKYTAYTEPSEEERDSAKLRAAWRRCEEQLRMAGLYNPYVGCTVLGITDGGLVRVSPTAQQWEWFVAKPHLIERALECGVQVEQPGEVLA